MLNSKSFTIVIHQVEFAQTELLRPHSLQCIIIMQAII